MARRNKQNFFVNKYYKFLTIVLLLACFIIMFVPAAGIIGRFTGTGAEAASVNFWQVVFGYEKTLQSGLSGVLLKFSFPALLVPLLLILGGIIPIIKDRRLSAIVSTASFAAAAVLSFMLTVIAMPSNALSGYDLVLKAGAILVGSFSVIGAALGCIRIFVK